LIKKKKVNPHSLKVLAERKDFAEVETAIDMKRDTDVYLNEIEGFESMEDVIKEYFGDFPEFSKYIL
jgi:hypothetical protein